MKQYGKYTLIQQLPSSDKLIKDRYNNHYILTHHITNTSAINLPSQIYNKHGILQPYDHLTIQNIQYIVYYLPQQSQQLRNIQVNKWQSQLYCLTIIYGLVNQVCQPLIQLLGQQMLEYLQPQNIWLNDMELSFLFVNRKQQLSPSHNNQQQKQLLIVQKLCLQKLSMIFKPIISTKTQQKTFLSILLKTMFHKQLTFSRFNTLMNNKKQRRKFMHQNLYIFTDVDEMWNNRSPSKIRNKRYNDNITRNRRNLKDSHHRQLNMGIQDNINSNRNRIHIPPSFTRKRNSFNHFQQSVSKSKSRNSKNRYYFKAQKSLSNHKDLSSTINYYQTSLTQPPKSQSIELTSITNNIKERALKKFKQNRNTIDVSQLGHMNNDDTNKCVIKQKDLIVRNLFNNRTQAINIKQSVVEHDKTRKNNNTISHNVNNNRFVISKKSSGLLRKGQQIKRQLFNVLNFDEIKTHRQQIKYEKKCSFEDQLQNSNSNSMINSKIKTDNNLSNMSNNNIINNTDYANNTNNNNKRQQQQKRRQQQRLKIQQQKLRLKQQKLRLQQQKRILRQQKLKQQRTKQQKLRQKKQKQQRQKQQRIRQQKLRQQRQKQERIRQQKLKQQRIKQQKLKQERQKQQRMQKQQKQKKQIQNKQKQDRQQSNTANNNKWNLNNIDQIGQIETTVKLVDKQQLKNKKPPLPPKSNQNNNNDDDDQIQEINLNQKPNNKNINKNNNNKSQSKIQKKIQRKNSQNLSSKNNKKSYNTSQKSQQRQNNTHKRVNTGQSSVASSYGPKKPVHKQVAQYMHMINKMGQAVAKSSKISNKLGEIQWFTGVYFIYKRFLLQRKKIQKWLSKAQPKLTRYPGQADQSQWNKWFADKQCQILYQKTKNQNQSIISSISKMNKKIMKKNLPGNFLFHAALNRHSDQQSKIAVSEVVREFDSLQQAKLINDPQVFAHVNDIINSLYILAELDGKFKQKRPLLQILKKKTLQEIQSIADQIYEIYLPEDD